MPKNNRQILKKYDLNRPFTTKGGFEYYTGNDPTEHLQLWMRAASSTQIDNNGAGSVTFTQSGHEVVNDLSPFDRSEIGNLKKNLWFNDAGEALITSKFMNVGDGSGNDTAFSIHMWVKIQFAGTTGSVVGTATTAGTGLTVSIQSGNIVFSLYQSGAGCSVQSSATAALTDDGWTHLVFTYDGKSSGQSAPSRMKIYVNGSAATTTSSDSGYTGQANESANLTLSATTIAASRKGLAELAVYHSRVITAEEVSALYDVAVNGLAQDSLKIQELRATSGITSLATRVYLSERDNMTGSYPATLRSPRDGRSGDYASRFDDTKTIIFASASDMGVPAAVRNRAVVLGQQLPVGSQYSGSLVSSPNTVPDLSATNLKTSVIPGVSDQRVNFTPGEDFRPFKEHDLYAADRIGTSDPFWTTGSLIDDVGAGFIQPLWSKTSFEINVEPAETSDVFFSTGSVTGPVGSGISYFDFSNRKFQMIGDLTTGDHVDYMANRFDRVTGSMLAFSPVHGAAAYFSTTTPGAFANRTAEQYKKDGTVTPVAGFPFAQKFHATSSQLLSVDEFIKAPFILEKIVYEFSASLPELPAMGSYLGYEADFSTLCVRTPPVIHNFFILNQRPFDLVDPIGIKVRGQFPHLNGAASGPKNKVVHFQPASSSQRDIVYVGQVSCLQTPVLDASGAPGSTSVFESQFYTASLYKRDLNIFQNFSTTQGITSSFILSGAANSPVASDFAFSIVSPTYRPGGILVNTAMIANCPSGGGRTGLAQAHRGSQLSSPRSLVRGAAGGVAEPILSNATSLTQFFPSDNATFSRSEKSYDVSPYVLMPGDKLILGWANQQTPVPAEVRAQSTNVEQALQDHPLRILPGAGKIKLYGSLLKEGKEFHEGPNQLLTSDAVHEDVSSNLNPYGQSVGLDQEERMYYQEFSGSYVDRVIGTFNPRSSGNGGRTGQRVGSVLGGDASTTGSILRATRIVDGHERFLDSTWPDPSVIATANGTGFRLDSGAVLESALNQGRAFYPMGSLSAGYAVNPDVTWPRAYPFEEKYGFPNEERFTTIPATRVRKSLGNTALRPNQESIVKIFVPLTPPQELGETGTTPYVIAQNTTLSPTRHQNREFLKMFFGFGDAQTFNLAKVKSPHAATGFGAGAYFGKFVEIRGFKYGLINTEPQFSSCVYRFGRYGQIRDMLEQRLFTAFQEFRVPDKGGNFDVALEKENTIEAFGQKLSPITAQYKAITFSSANGRITGDVTLQAFTQTDRDQVKKNASFLDVRGIWNSKCNIDDYARSNRPFVDADRIIASGSLPGSDIQLTEEIADLAG